MMAEETFQRLPWVISQPRNRQTSTTSSASAPSTTEEKSAASKPHPRQRRPSPQSKNPISPWEVEKSKGNSKRSASSKSMSFGSRDGSSRASVGTMNDSAGEVTYTPTTHRISKAKKGKKVHACEFPGCPKIFTRAEHRKRHEANHNSEPAFQCCIEDCRKPFQRSDLLARHMERQHNMPAEASLARSSRSQRSASEPSIADSNPSSSGMVPATMGQPQPLRGQAMPQTAGTMSIGSIIEPSMRNDYGHHGRISNDLSNLAVGVGPRTLPAELIYGISAAAESPLYSSDNSCYSPMSDYLKPQTHGQSYLPPDAVSQAQTSPLEANYQPQLMTSPLSTASAYPVWEQFDSSVLGGQLDGPYLPTQNRQYQYPSPTWIETNTSPYEMNLPPQQPWPWRVTY